MEFGLKVELKVPEGLMSNLAEVDKTKLEKHLQECMIKYLSTQKQFNFEDISEMPAEIEAELLPRDFIARPTQPFKFDDIGAITNEELNI